MLAMVSFCTSFLLFVLLDFFLLTESQVLVLANVLFKKLSKFSYLELAFPGISKFFHWTAEHMQDIIGLLFKYIHLLQQSGICKWMFDEVCKCIVYAYI